jgi:hypothetical protein
VLFDHLSTGNFVLRGSTPAAFTLAALAFCLPHTASNLHQRLLLAEERHAPGLARLHRDALQNGRALFRKIESKATILDRQSYQLFHRGRQTAFSSLGLKQEEMPEARS